MEAKSIAAAVSALADEAVKQSLDRTEVRFEMFKQQVLNKIGEISGAIPVLHVRLNEQEPRQLTKRACANLPRLIANAKLGLNTLLVGPAGCGKTTMAYQVAESLGRQFGSVCLTAGASETWLFGRQTPTGFVEGMFSKIYREGGVFLADEMDAADANLLLSINTALSHSEMLNPMSGEIIKKHPEFIFIGAANTNGKGANHMYTGRSRLDAATLDRFVLVNVSYDRTVERDLCPHGGLYDCLQNIRDQMLRDGFDEIVSTRAFTTSYVQMKAGISINEIRDSLISNWSEPAKELAKSKFSNAFPSGKVPQQGPYDSYQANVMNKSSQYKSVMGDLPW